MEDGWISREMNINMKRSVLFPVFAARITLSPKEYQIRKYRYRKGVWMMIKPGGRP